MVYSNVHDNIVEHLLLPPLQDITGSDSDHKCVYVAAAFKATSNFTWKVKKRRLRDQRREDAFVSELRDGDWSSLDEASCVDDQWVFLEDRIRTLTEKHFPLVTVRKRSNESPWITRAIRRLWKKKIRIYKKEGRSQAWWDTDRIVQQKIETSRVEFVEKMLEEGTAGRSFYTAMKKLPKAAVVPQWSVKDLYAGQQAPEICNEVLDYFGSIATGRATALDGPRCTGGLDEFSVDATRELLTAVKKSDSYVDGDPFPT